MAFIIFQPLGKKAQKELTTTSVVEKQLWQELVVIRHFKKPNGVNGNVSTASWMDQAKTYLEER